MPERVQHPARLAVGHFVAVVPATQTDERRPESSAGVPMPPASLPVLGVPVEPPQLDAQCESLQLPTACRALSQLPLIRSLVQPLKHEVSPHPHLAMHV